MAAGFNAGSGGSKERSCGTYNREDAQLDSQASSHNHPGREAGEATEKSKSKNDKQEI